MWQKTEKRQSLWQTHNTECTGLSHCWEGRRSMRRTNCETRRRRTKQNKKLEGVSREERLVYLFLNHQHHPPQPPHLSVFICHRILVMLRWWGGGVGLWLWLSLSLNESHICLRLYSCANTIAARLLGLSKLTLSHSASVLAPHSS